MAGIFINYRRDDAPGVAGRLFDRLSKNFSPREIFMDVDAMRPGLDFVKQLDEQVSKCDVVLAVIGPGWLNAVDEKGRRKLDLPRDYVRIELASALRREIPVIPLLVNGTAMPFEEDLPEELKSLPNRHALELRHTRFAADSDAVIRALNDIMPRRGRLRRITQGVAAALVLLSLAGGVGWWRMAHPAMPMEAVTKQASNLPSGPERPVAAPGTQQANAAAAPAVVASAPAPKVAQNAPSSTAATNAPRVALVIGNARYPDANSPLKTPINDSRLVANALKQAGFAVTQGENLTGQAMRQTFDQFFDSVKTGSIALLFFSGYGIQSDHENYLIPIDAQIWTEAEVRRDGLSLVRILDEINHRGAAVKITLLDASWRNPFERRFRTHSAGLASVDAPPGTLVMYSTSISSAQSDNGGSNSLFVSELLKNVGAPNLTAEEALNRTRMAISAASHNEQVPWISSSLAESFSLVPGSPQPR